MLKRLTTIGNSIALVIDKPIRERLGIGRNTVVALSTNGKSLIVEPQPPGTEIAGRTLPPDPQRAAELEARAVASTLEHVYGMTADHVERLTGRRTFAIIVFNQSFDLEQELHRTAIARMKTCLAELQGGATWEAAIEQARRQLS